MKIKVVILLGFIILKFVLQYLLIHPAYDLHRDEYLHIDQGYHLAWGYISVTPVTSWISFIIILLGKGYFWVKFFPALFGALTIVVVWKIIEELEGGLFALVVGALAILFSVFLRINILYQPNSLDVLNWTLTYLFIIKYINSKNSNWLFALALTIGFGILSKYNIIFLLVGLVPAFLLTEHRKVFLNKKLYISIGIIFVIILPNLIWQYQNHFPTFYQLQELNRTQLVNVDRFNFIKDQFLYFLGPLILIVLAFFSFFMYPPFRKYRLVFWSYLFTMIIFILLKAKSYYAVGLYPVLIAMGAVYFEKISVEGWRKYLRPVIILWIFGCATLLFLAAMPYQSPAQIQKNIQRYKSLGVLRWEDGKDHDLPQDFADMIGWSELAKKVDSIYSLLPNKQNTFVLCDNYGQAGAINYYTRQQIRAVTFNADYINWFDLSIKYENLIRVKGRGDEITELEETSPFFQKSILADSVANTQAREYGTTIFAFTGAKIDFRERLKNEINERKY